MSHNDLEGAPVHVHVTEHPPRRSMRDYRRTAADFDTLDIMAFGVATIMTLGPLFAYAIGFRG